MLWNNNNTIWVGCWWSQNGREFFNLIFKTWRVQSQSQSQSELYCQICRTYTTFSINEISVHPQWKLYSQLQIKFSPTSIFAIASTFTWSIKKKTKKTISGFLPGTRVSLGIEWLECEKKGRTFMNSWWKNKNENGAGGGSLSAVNEDAVSLPLPTPCLSTLSFFYPHAGLLLSHPLLATRGGSRRLSAPSSLGVS